MEDFSIIEVLQNARSTDLIQPLTKPVVTNTNIGLMLKNDFSNAKTVYQPLQKDVVQKMVSVTNENLIPKPQSDQNEVWRIFRDYTIFENYSKPNQLSRNNTFIRPYYFESDYLKAARQLHGFEYLNERTSSCSNQTDIDENEYLDDVRKNWSDYYGNDKTWIESSSSFLKFSEEERKEKMFLVGEPFHSKASKWYHSNYPSPDLPIIINKFSK